MMRAVSIDPIACFCLQSISLNQTYLKSKSIHTIGIHHVIKHCLVCVPVCGWQVQYNVIIASHEFLHLNPVVPLQEGTDGPHQSEDVQVFIVGLADRARVLVVLRGDQSLQQLAGL